MTSAVPVYDGYVLKKGILHQSIGGDLLSEQIKEHLKNDLQLNLTPPFKISSKKPVEAGQQPQIQLRDRANTTKSFEDYHISVKYRIWKIENIPIDILCRKSFMNLKKLLHKYQKFHLMSGKKKTVACLGPYN